MKNSINNSIGLSLSGGGFRASLFHLGLLRCIFDAGLLKNVSHISGVSGGSILGAHLVHHWTKYNDEMSFDKMAQEFIGFIKSNPRSRILRRTPWRFIPGNSPYQVFKEELEKHLFKGEKDDSNTVPEFYSLTTCLTLAKLCSFSNNNKFCIDDFDNPVEILGSLTLAQQVALSASFPGLFPPKIIKAEDVGVSNEDFGASRHSFCDGGVSDNSGIRKFEILRIQNNCPPDIIVSDAAIKMDNKTPLRGLFSIPVSIIRSIDILMDQIAKKDVKAVESDPNFLKDKMCYIVRLSDQLNPKTDEYALNLHLQYDSARIRTDLDKFNELEIHSLIRHGYTSARQQILKLAKKRKLSLPENFATNPPWFPRVGRMKNDTNIVNSKVNKNFKRLKNSSKRKVLSSIIGRDLYGLLNGAILLALVSLILFFTFSDSIMHYHSTNSNYDRIVASNKIRVYISSSLQQGWFLSHEKDGSFEGFDVDFCNLIANRFHEVRGHKGEDKLEVSFVVKPFNDLFSKIKDGSADIIISSISKTSEREKQYNITFSEPYFETVLSLLCRNNDIKKDLSIPELIKGKKIAVKRGTTAHRMIKALNDERNLNCEITHHGNFNEAFYSFKGGEADYVISDKPFIENITAANVFTSKDFSSDIYPKKYKEKSELYSIGVHNKEPKLLEVIDEIILDAKAQNKIDDLEKMHKSKFIKSKFEEVVSFYKEPYKISFKDGRLHMFNLIHDPDSKKDIFPKNLSLSQKMAFMSKKMMTPPTPEDND